MKTLSLADTLKIHRDQGRACYSLMPKGGEFDVSMYTVPDAELARTDPDAWKQGKRDFREVKHNLVTRYLREFAGDNGQLLGTGGARVFISPDTDSPHVLKDVYRATYTGGNAACSSFLIDTVSRLWTITGTILAPAAGKVRTFWTVGVANSSQFVYGTSAEVGGVYAATKLSSERNQDETQQVVISYRLAWEEARNV